MSSQDKPGYMLLFRNTDWAKNLSPEEIQRVMTEWKGWFDRLANQGIVKAGHPLEPAGKIVSGRKGNKVADGPFPESKEAIGGYFFLDVGSLDEAVAIAKDCPGLDYGAFVEVRPVAEVCPCAKGLQEQEALAHAAA